MEKYLSEPPKEKVDEFYGRVLKSVSCVKATYDIDSLLFAFILSTQGNRQTAITFGKGENCELSLVKGKDGGKRVILEGDELILGRSSFSSLVPVNSGLVLPILLGMFASSVMERRQLTQLEEARLEEATQASRDLTVEDGFKLPNYKHLPLFSSLTLSIDPYFPGISGNRQGAEAVLRELKIDLTANLESLSDAQKNSLGYRLVLTAQKHNPTFSNSDLFGRRAFLKDLDLLELTFASMYVLDTLGPGYLFQTVNDPHFAEVLVHIFRDEVGRGFKIDAVTERNNAVVVETNLKSPLLVRQILLQAGKLRPDKVVAISVGSEVYTSRYFTNSGKEGLIRI
ncbi:MAG: single-stranded DNA exonuclease [Thermoprotei archaeon]